MTVVGITGKSGAGKSRACSYIEQKGYPVIDGDRIAHEELKENNSLQNELIEAFGGKIVKNGELDRKALGSIVFSDDEKLKLLNRISHKYILEHFDRLKEKYQEQGFKAVFIDAAALIESGYPCDAMVFIKADKEFRKSRILDRDNIKEN
ncbi:MAG: dephospho-CoA kinase, partial [Bacillota bacterium]|nr:dephospho-CoA kinase [Bacillota bacterium]